MAQGNGNGNNRPINYDHQTESVQGKSILVTGGTTGIGRMTALLLASQGAKVLIFGRHEQELNDAMNDIKQAGGEVYGLTADQSNHEDVLRVFQAVDEQLGGLDILINCAALGAQSILDTEYSDFEYIVRSNLLGYMACAKEAIPRMKQKGTGHLVDVGSMSAKVREEGSDVYVATKSAIRGFTDSLAKQLNKDGIRVTLIEPGLVGTDMTTDQVPADKQEEQQEKMEMLRAEDIAEMIYFAITQPKRCDVALVQIRPTKQII